MKCKECASVFCFYREADAEKECVFSFPHPSGPIYSVPHTGTFPLDVDQEVSRKLSKEVSDIIINQVRDAMTIELDGCIDPNSGELHGLDLTKLKQFCEVIGQSDVKVTIKKR